MFKPIVHLCVLNNATDKEIIEKCRYSWGLLQPKIGRGDCAAVEPCNSRQIT